MSPEKGGARSIVATLFGPDRKAKRSCFRISDNVSLSLGHVVWDDGKMRDDDADADNSVTQTT